MIKLIVGLGNPGPRYARTRHNIGFRVVDYLIDAASSARIVPSDWERGGWQKWDATSEVAEFRTPKGKLVLLKPLDFMNRSGGPTQKVSKFFGIKPEEILVVHDEIDLPFGRLRLKHGGGEAGHNGLRSISEMLGTKDYTRLRCGVGKPITPTGEEDQRTPGIKDWVLERFSESEEKELAALLMERAARAIGAVVEEEFKIAQERVNRD